MNMSQNLKFEDTVQCYIFSTSPVAKGDWKNICDTINKDIALLSQNYIWHRDEFKLSVSVFGDEKNDLPPHLISTSCFGDNIEDEWFIVYLALNITRQHQDLIVLLEDNDGDFLLIEAADFLPIWANPETTQNRVFIYLNHIHIIPPELIGLDSKVEVENAIRLVKQRPEETKASTEIQQAVLSRIGSYPQKIQDNNHRAFVYLPLDIATILTLKPSLISSIVSKYCNHDMLDEKCVKNIKFDNCLMVPVLFTKYLYAMLLHSKSPRIKKGMNNLEMTENSKETMLGMKIASGYEIIMNGSSHDIFSSKEYNKFLNSLIKNGYFKDNIEGSREYKELLEIARNYFSNVECPTTSFYYNSIQQLKNTEEFKKLKDILRNRDIAEMGEPDGEEWLNVQPDELNSFLNTRYGKKFDFKRLDPITPQTITSELTNFLKKNSDFEGIENHLQNRSDTDQIEFDSDQFMNCIEKMLNIITNDNNDSDEHSDFGEEDDSITQDVDDSMHEELTSKLFQYETNSTEDKVVMRNLLQSIKEEGTTGPSSNLLKNIGLNKIEVIDSDDD